MEPELHAGGNPPRLGSTVTPSGSADSQHGLMTSSSLPMYHAQHNEQPNTNRSFRRHFRGWKIIVLGSWLNLLLFLLPASWAISVAMPKSHGVVFICCILSLIPLVRLHDLSTRDLSLRIGGSKTGLVNATMSNLIEIVVAFSALRKCELRIVQSSLVGSMLSKLLLVLGMCFFAGGMRFSEQDFDPTATQIHSSLLSISVGAVVLPAAYHFSLNRATAENQQERRGILKMSHGVSVILLFIYASYLLFQLWSHTHLYKDSQKQSNRLSVKLPKRTPIIFGKQRSTRSDPSSPVDKSWNPKHIPFMRPSTMSSEETIALSVPRPLYLTSAGMRSDTTLASYYHSGDEKDSFPVSPISQAFPLPPSETAVGSTVRLVPRDGYRGMLMNRDDPSSSSSSSNSGTCYSSRSSSRVALREERVPELGELRQAIEDMPEALRSDDNQPVAGSTSPKPEPQLSLIINTLLLTIVTVVVAVTADELVESMDEISTTISKQWIGLILLPAVASVAECITAVNTSVKDQLTFSINLAVGSTIQTALFVIPLMVTLGWIMNKPLSLLFDPFESIVLYISVQTMSYVVADGKSNWLEGVILVCLYVVIAVAFWYYPESHFVSSLTPCSVPLPV